MNNIKSVPLVQREENLRFAGLENEVENLRYYESVKNPKLYKQIANGVIAISLTLTVAAAGLGIQKYVDDIKQEINSEIVYVTDVPDDFDGTLDLKVLVQANGVAFFEDKDGNQFAYLNDNISAEHVAKITGYQGKLANTETRTR